MLFSGCVCVTATYDVISEGKYSLLNYCRFLHPKSPITWSVDGTITPADPSQPNNGNLTATINHGPAPYQIVAVDTEEYQWSAVVSCTEGGLFGGGSLVWILARDPTFRVDQPKLYQEIVDKVKKVQQYSDIILCLSLPS